MKCHICGKKVETTFLNKVVGTFARDKKGKKRLVCSACQKNNPGKQLTTKL